MLTSIPEINMIKPKTIKVKPTSNNILGESS